MTDTNPPRGLLGLANQRKQGPSSYSLLGLVNDIFNKNAALKRHADQFAVYKGEDPGDGRQLESYPPWESWNPQPGKATTVLYNTSVPQDMQQNLIKGDMLHYMGAVNPETGQAVDPTYRALKEQLLGTLTPEQQAVDKRAYESERKFYGDNPPSFADWMDTNRGDAYVRGLLTPDARDEWKNVYTPEQRRQLQIIADYLIRGSLAPGMR